MTPESDISYDNFIFDLLITFQLEKETNFNFSCLYIFSCTNLQL